MKKTVFMLFVATFFISCSSHLKVPEMEIREIFESNELKSVISKKLENVPNSNVSLIVDQVGKIKNGKWFIKSYGDWYQKLYYNEYSDENDYTKYEIVVSDEKGKNCMRFIYNQGNSWVLENILLEFECSD